MAYHAQSISRDNHFIPQMYLKQWTNENNRVHLYRFLVSHSNVPAWIEKPVSSVGVFKNLYTRLTPNGENDDFEHMFDARFESPAKNALMKALNCDQMTSQDWDKLLDFVAALYVRTPASFAYNAKSFSEICEDGFQGLIDNIPNESLSFKENYIYESQSDLLPITIKFHKCPENGKIEFDASMPKGKSAWLFAIKTLLDDNSVLRSTIKSFKWSVATCHPSVSWPTSDYPLLVIREDSMNCQLILNSHIGDPNIILFLPISPKKALVTSKQKKLPSRFELDENESFLYKEAIIRNAFSELYCNTEDIDIEKVRTRTIDPIAFNCIKNEQDEFYNAYSKIEGPLLQRQSEKEITA